MMSPSEAIAAVYSGRLVECSYADWPEIRAALQLWAGECIDCGHDIRAQIALQEVKRLDAKFWGTPE